MLSPKPACMKRGRIHAIASSSTATTNAATASAVCTCVMRNGSVWKMPPTNVPPPTIAARANGCPRAVRRPSSESPSATPIEIPAPTADAAPTRNAAWLEWLAKTVAKIGASVETEPSVRPARPGCTILSTSALCRSPPSALSMDRHSLRASAAVPARFRARRRALGSGNVCPREPRVHDRNEHQREEQRAENSADDDSSEARADARPRLERERQRNVSGDDRHAGHDDRAEARVRAFHDRPELVAAAPAQRVRVVDEQDPVLRHDADQHDRPDQRKQVEGLVRDRQRSERADGRDGNREHDDER